MASFGDFARDIRTISFRPGQVGAQAVEAEMATFARTELDRAIRSGEGSPIYDLYVNGQKAVSEFDVEVPGAILYVFSWWNEIIAAALEELIKRSPVRSGRYASSFVVMVNGAGFEPGAEIPPGAEVVIFNAQPYTRKVEVGAMVMSVAPRHFDKARGALRRKFGSPDDGFSFRFEFIKVPAGIHPLVPYTLRGEYDRKRTAYLSAAAAGTLQHGARKFPRRKSQQAGEELTYPALVMRMVN